MSWTWGLVEAIIELSEKDDVVQRVDTDILMGFLADIWISYISQYSLVICPSVTIEGRDMEV